MNCVIGKPAFFKCENKGADQLRAVRAPSQRLSFRYMDSAIPRLFKSEISILYPSLWLYSLVCVEPYPKPQDKFSPDAAHIVYRYNPHKQTTNNAQQRFPKISRIFFCIHQSTHQRQRRLISAVVFHCLDSISCSSVTAQTGWCLVSSCLETFKH